MRSLNNLDWQIRLAQYALEDELIRHETMSNHLKQKLQNLQKQKEESFIDGA